MPTDLPATYGASRARITGLVRDLPQDDLARTVPGCPDWTVQDLVAHCVGVAADAVAGNGPAGDFDEWTAAQVSKRRGTPLADVLAEWDTLGIESALPSLPGYFGAILTVDLVTHEHDLRGAVGRTDPDDDHVRFAARGYARTLGARVDETGLPALQLGGVATAGSGEPGATVRASTYELFRALAGRRSEAQVRAYEWEGDPAPYLAILSPFGPLPAADVIEG